MTMTSLTDFLLARIAEDEEQAHRSLANQQRNPNLRIPAEWVNGVVARVLAECEAKRRIVERLEPITEADLGCVCDRCLTLRDLASVYADHPDYNPEWRP